MNTYEEYPVGEAYLLSVDGETVGPALLFETEGNYTLDTVGNVKDVTGFESSVTDKGLLLTSKGSPDILLSKLSVSDAKMIFPHTIRKFKSVDSLVASVTKEIMDSNSYTPVIDETGETVSITVDASGAVLELIRADEQGELYYRSGGDWVLVGEDDDAPTIFDQIVIDIEVEDIDRAIEYYDKNIATKESISKDEMLEFAALVQ